ncbi:MAG: hypothetical protein EOO38_12470 [Cytophagaceae bacterium]|nr:MAG: hypothetical protein EOO38_12470 [Cytophagaceae bacterium]
MESAMQILPIAVTALALSRHAHAQSSAPCKLNITEDQLADAGPPWHLGLPFMGGNKPIHTDLAEAKRASGQPFAPFSTQNGMCLDVQGNRMQSGTAVQLWQCNGGQSNQGWRTEGPLFQTSNDLCLDVPYGNAFSGAKLQVWKCDGNNPNQKWNKLGDSLQWQGARGNYCLDVSNGFFKNGNMIQLWSCYPGSANQAFSSLKQASTGGATSAATDFYGYKCISLDDFIKKYPWCADYKGAFQSAGANQGINPVFLGAIAMAESTCGAGLKNSPQAWAGPFQFSSNEAWSFYGGRSKDRTNPWDAAYGAARYFNALLKQTNGNLYQAMREYNGPIGEGGSSSYQSDIAGFMAGTK